MPQKAAGATALRRLGPGPTLRRRRLKLGLTLVELADQCAQAEAPVSHSHLSKLERGMYAPRPRLRSVLIRLLALDEDHFEADSDTPEGTTG
ncbi:helix-turn-helix domain-containing protein [Streptomyces erythrochromogenes]|uniref:helix-turn-helix domain-containing protein n=1 Tax=Streptomyces erythrochromogenes TaxID=285574 RepID=UPI0034155A7A